MICPHCLYTDSYPTQRCVSCGRRQDVKAVKPPPFVGRSQELALLDEQLQDAVKNRAPRIVAVAGKPQVGRSHLLSELGRRFEHEFSDVVVVRGYVVPDHRRTDRYAPFGRLLRNSMGLSELDTVEAAREKARKAVGALEPPSLPEALLALGKFLGLRFTEAATSPVARTAPEDQRRREFAAYAWYLKQLADQRPLLILIERLREALPDGMELLAYLRSHLADCPLLMVCEIDREAFVKDPAYFRRYGHGVLPVEPLSREAVGELMQRLADRPSPPPANLVELAYEAARGRPANVVQAIETLRERGILKHREPGWGVDAEGPLKLDFPLTEEQAARQRLEALTDIERSWLRRAAVAGPAFWRNSLIPLARSELGAREGMTSWLDTPSQSELESALQRAVEHGILTPVNTPTPHGSRYAFVRERERDLLLAELAPKGRLAMHAVVAEWLEYRMGLEDEELLVEIAEHYHNGSNGKRAASYYIMAGELARRRYANDAAVDRFERAIQFLDGRDALPVMDVSHALGALHALRGSNDAAEACFERMLGYAWVLDHPAKAGAALNRLGRLYRERALYERAVALFEQGRDLFVRAGDTAGVASSVDDLGQVALRRGDIDQAMKLFNEALTIRRNLKELRPIALSLTNLAVVQRNAGYYKLAEKGLLEGLKIREQLQDQSGVVASQIEYAQLLMLRGDLEDATQKIDEALSVARQTGDLSQTATGLVTAALIAAHRSKPDDARRFAEEAGALAEQLGDIRTQIRSLRATALIEVESSRGTEALPGLNRAATLADQHGEKEERGICLRLLGQVHGQMSGLDIQAAIEEVRAGIQEGAGKPDDKPNSKATTTTTTWGTFPADEGIRELIDDATSGRGPAADSIRQLIDDALETESREPGAVARLDAAGRAHLEAALEDYADAVRLLAEVRNDPESARALLELAELVEATGDTERARTLERRALVVDAAYRSRVAGAL